MNQEEGIRASYEAASEEWKATAKATIYFLAERRRSFTTDDVIDILESHFPQLTANYSALGGIVRSCMNEQAISYIDCDHCGTHSVVVPSSRVQAHSKKITLYKSLIYKENS